MCSDLDFVPARASAARRTALYAFRRLAPRLLYCAAANTRSVKTMETDFVLDLELDEVVDDFTHCFTGECRVNVLPILYQISQVITESGHRGNMTEAAKELGVTRRVLGLRMERHGIEYKAFRKQAS
jgi:hypothetical protein